MGKSNNLFDFHGSKTLFACMNGKTFFNGNHTKSKMHCCNLRVKVCELAVENVNRFLKKANFPHLIFLTKLNAFYHDNTEY